MEPDNKLIVREYIEKVINIGNIDIIDQFISEEYTEVFKNKRYVIGIKGAKEHIIGVRKTYPDLKLSIDRQICEGDLVATCYTMRGTHKGEWMGIKPTGKILEVTGVNIDKVIDGKLVEHGGAANLFDGLLEIGAIKVVGENEG
ncbi:MAG: ester cyclase [Bacteroidales bacterium]|nr:ester cyclase [Bacteroidales bacterium]